MVPIPDRTIIACLCAVNLRLKKCLIAFPLNLLSSIQNWPVLQIGGHLIHHEIAEELLTLAEYGVPTEKCNGSS